MSGTERTVRFLAKLYPYEVEASQELIESLAFVESPVDARTVVRSGYGAGIVTLLVVLPLLALPIPLWGVFLFSFIAALGAIQVVHSFPRLLAAFRRTRALGETPDLIGRAVLRMQIQPSTETAIRFAAETGYGPLAKSLQAHIDQSLGTAESGLLSFADEWAEEFPALRRSAHLLSTAEDAPEGERGRTLERSLHAVLTGTREQMADFTEQIRGPTTALYAFGVMLPLALVALLPAMRMADIRPGIGAYVLLYDVLLPTMLVVTSVWLLQRRPAAFPPPQVTRSHPDVNQNLALIALAAGGSAAAAFASVQAFAVGYLAPIVALGIGPGVALYLYFKPIKSVGDHVRAIEKHLVDALYLVGRQVSEGESVEAGLEQAADKVPAETGDLFEQAAGVQRRLHVDVDEAFNGAYGALNDVPSPRANGTAALLSIASNEGKPAGRAVVAMADHLEELQEVEREAKRQLSMVTGTLDQTASFFGPIIAGATIALSKVIESRSQGASLSMSGSAEVASGSVDAAGQAANSAGAASSQATVAFPTESLAIVVGAYVLMMSVILTTLSVGLKHGLDRTLVGCAVGKALFTAMLLFTGTFLLTNGLIG
ncbi:secretion system protein [Halorubellus sp. JP-L1]|uniref:secretion system protein n=1 Tax=Halorubellus sp. JP-L1 TaxID=2715753 RepID=UPI001407C46C|nr:secretion system protein [Halorubellus sp. JP-L1]NHN40933.1 secretion system protein [Halorubellus sp. JP-L1]